MVFRPSKSTLFLGNLDGHLKMKNLRAILDKVQSRTEKGSSSFYKPLPPDESQIVRLHYLSQLKLSPNGDPRKVFWTPVGTVLATGYERVVIGDYGAYIEFTDEQMALDQIIDRFKGEPNRTVKYIWMKPVDGSDVKVYLQVNTVNYADYRPGYFYISPTELVFD